MYQGMNGGAPILLRSNSQICPTPQEELLEATLNNKVQRIEQLLSRNELLLNYTYPDYNKRILLIACSEQGVNAATVEKLLNLRANPRDYNEADGWEALHFAAQKTDFDVLNVLVKRNPGDVTNCNLQGGNALHVLIRHGDRSAKEEFLKCARLLIQKGIDVDQVDNNNKSALYWADKKGIGEEIRQIVKEEGTNLAQPAINNNAEEGKTEYEQLLNILIRGDEERFLQVKHSSIESMANFTECDCTLLQFACEHGLAKCVRRLLEQGADPNRTGRKNGKKPIVIASEHGFSDIFDALLEKYNPISNIPEGVLGIVLQYIDRKQHDNRDCYRAFINKVKQCPDPDEISLKLNEVDSGTGNTALHYATKYAEPDVVKELLSLGGSLGAKNDYGNMPIQDMEPDTLEKHLDNCIEFDINSKKIDKEDFQVKFNYRSIIPPYAKCAYNEACSYKDVEATGINSTIQKDLVAETEVIFYMSKTSEFRHLLKHPVIVSFLFMKWLRIQWLFWANLAFYIAFAVSLVVYIFSNYAYFSTEEKSPIQILLQHVSYICLLVTLFVLFFRELFQMCAAPTKYFKGFENYIEIILATLTAMIVFIGSPSHDTRKQLSSISILLAAFELVLMLGQHPYFSTNVVMLKTVSFNFFKFLIWYSLLIIAFALSFYLLFTVDPQSSVNNTTIQVPNESSPDEDTSFDNPGQSVFKTIIMLTGEFDASSINFNTFPVTSKLIFALFIFMIAIILLNLLNGLAVSDTQMIKNDAELVGHIARAQHIRYVENMLVENILPVQFLHKLSAICCCLPLVREWNFKFSKALPLNPCLFPNHLNYELVFFPNKKGLIEPGDHDHNRSAQKCAPCAHTCLDRETVRRTNTIIQARREANENDSTKKLENKIDYLEKMVSQIWQCMLKMGTPSENL